MRKFLLLGAVVALVSACSMNSFNNGGEGNDECIIEFSTYSDKTTRGNAGADYVLEDYHQDFVVYGSKKTSKDVSMVFDSVVCTFDADSAFYGSHWAYTPARFWDRQALNYRFAAYAPKHARMQYTFDTEVGHAAAFKSVGPLVLTGTNLQGDASDAEINVGFTGKDGKDLDVMITDTLAQEITAFPSQMPDVNLIFKHTLAKLVVTLCVNDTNANYDVKITNIELKNFYSEGEYDGENGWTADTTSTLIDYRYNGCDTTLGEEKLYFIESLILPQAFDSTMTLIVDYEITSYDPNDPDTPPYTEEFTYEEELPDIFEEYIEGEDDEEGTDDDNPNIEDNTSYDIDIKINPEDNVITFDAGARQWDIVKVPSPALF